VQDLNSLNGTHKNGWRSTTGILLPACGRDPVAMGVDTFLAGESPAALASWAAAG
jgi:hypothetical protein